MLKSRSKKTKNRQALNDSVFRELAAELGKKSSEPLYRQISEYIKARIEEGRLIPGEQLSSERRIMEVLQVSRPTVRTALTSLIEASYIRSVHGCGNFVAEPPAQKQWRILALQDLEARHNAPQFFYNSVHKAEQKFSAKVHYTHVQSAEQLREALLHPPSGYDGLSIFRPCPEWIEELLRMEQQGLDAKIPLPLMLMERELRDSRYNFISVDNSNVGYQAASKLIDAGHRRIGYICALPNLDYAKQHFSRFQAALFEAGLELLPQDQIQFPTLDREAMEVGLRSFLTDPGFTAVVVAGSSLSKPFEYVVQSTALVIPKRLSAILITERYVFDQLAIRWSSFVDPGSALVEHSIESLIALRKFRLASPVQEVLPFVFQEGASLLSRNENNA